MSAESATDGDTITYEAPNGGENLSVELTGVENTKSMSTSSTVSGSESLTATVGGTTAPRNEEVTLTGVETTSSGSASLGTLSDGSTESVDVGGNQPAIDEGVTLTGVETITSDSASLGTLSDGESTSVSVDGNIDARSESVTITGTETTSSDSASGSLSDGGSTSVSVGGNQDPTGESVTLSATVDETSASESGSASGSETISLSHGTLSSTSGSISLTDQPPDSTPVFQAGSDFSSIDLGGGESVTRTFDTSNIDTVGEIVIYGNFETTDLTIEIDGQKLGTYSRDTQSSAEDETFTGTPIPVGSTADMTLSTDSSATIYIVEGFGADIQFTEGETSSVEISHPGGTDTIGPDGSTPIDVSSNPGSIEISPNYGSVDYSVSYTQRDGIRDITVDAGSSTITHSGPLDGSISESIDLSTGSETISASYSGSSSGLNYNAEWTEVTATEDPSVTVGGETISYSGILTDGETTTLSGGDLSPGSNSVSVSTNAGSTVTADASWTAVTATEDPSVTLGGETVSHSGILSQGESTTLSGGDLSPGSNSVSVSTNGGSQVTADASWTAVTATEDPSVTVDGSTISYSGVLGDGETYSESVDLSTGSQSLDVSTSGAVDTAVSWIEVTETIDPTVSLNGNAMSHDGVVAEGETVTLNGESAWIEEGTNTVDIALNDSSLIAGSPIPKVDVSLSHDIRES
ncbi:hypothetical protein SAMN06264867_1261, partial [Halorubrum cibi]